MLTPQIARSRALSYLQRGAGGSIHSVLGHGKDGYVWRTSRPSALKIHAEVTSYRFERDAYMRFKDLGIERIGIFEIPTLIGHDDELLAIEMSIVLPPFIVDFASARLDWEPDLIEDDGYSFADMIRERFDEQTDQVMALHEQLNALAGIYLTDMHRDNVKFS